MTHLATRLLPPTEAKQMPIVHSMRDQEKIFQCRPILIGVPTIDRVNIGTVYQVAMNQPHVLAFPFIRENAFRVDVILTAADYSTMFRVRPARYNAECHAGHYHAEFYTPHDQLSPFFVMFSGLKGIHKLIVKASHMSPDRTPHSITTTLLVQESQQPHYDFHNEAIERFRFRLKYGISDRLIIPEQLIDPDLEADALWEATYDLSAKSYKAHMPKLASPALFEYEQFIKELDSYQPNRRLHLTAVCMLFETYGTTGPAVQSIRAFLHQHQMDNLKLEPLSVLPLYHDFHHPEDRISVSMSNAFADQPSTSKVKHEPQMPPPNPPAQPQAIKREIKQDPDSLELLTSASQME